MTAIPTAAPSREGDLTGERLPDIGGVRILIVGINYAPEPTGIAPYTTGMAEYLAGQGADVTVLTGIPHYPAWRVEPGLPRRLASSAEVNGVRVIRLRHSVPARMTAITRGLYEATFFANALLHAGARRADLVIAVSPALAGAVAATAIAGSTGAPLITIVQDLMAKAANESGIKGGGRVASIAARLEGFALRRSARVLIVSEGFRAAVSEYGVNPERISVLRNWTHITPAHISQDEARRLLGWPRAKFIAVHTGNMGFKQNLENVIEAGRLLGPNENIELVLVGDGSQRQCLERLAREVAAVRFVDPVSTEDYPAVLTAADVLLINERSSVAEMSLPSKLTSYLAAGRPVVAAVSPSGVTADELVRTEAAIVVEAENPELLVGALRDLYMDPSERERLAASGRTYATAVLTQSASLRRLHILLGLLAQQGRAE